MELSPNDTDLFISVDIETAGPNPSQYSLLTIGACTIAERPNSFYVELKPVNMNHVAQALAISHLSLERLAEKGVEPAAAMRRFEDWLNSITPAGQRPLFVAFNAPFDWMFVNDYFHRYLGRNPFGHTALDIKALYMGLTGVNFSETTMRYLMPRYLGDRQFTHHALRDAMDQAEIFQKILAEAQARRQIPPPNLWRQQTHDRFIAIFHRPGTHPGISPAIGHRDR